MAPKKFVNISMNFQQQRAGDYYGYFENHFYFQHFTKNGNKVGTIFKTEMGPIPA